MLRIGTFFTAHRISLLGLLFSLAVGLIAAGQAQAAPGQLRIGTLAPKNSLYHRQLMEVGEAWRSAQGEGAKYLVYPDGSQGGETDMARRMRIGQLQGALLSVVGLREIEPSISALQNMPLLFRSWDEVDYVREKMRPAIEKKFLDKGFVVLAWGDAGWVRFFSKEPAVRPDDYRKMKFFAWAGESEQQENDEPADARHQLPHSRSSAVMNISAASKPVCSAISLITRAMPPSEAEADLAEVTLRNLMAEGGRDLIQRKGRVDDRPDGVGVDGQVAILE